MDGCSLECNVYQICSRVKILNNFIAVMSILLLVARTLQGHVLSATIAQNTNMFYQGDATSAIFFT